MKKSIIAIASVVVISAGIFSGFAFAQQIGEEKKAVNEPIAAEYKIGQNYSNYTDMIGIMKDNGFKEQAEYMQNNDFGAMDDYMNNISDEDYNEMIGVMKSYGYGEMADAMQSIGKENMIKMHNAMSGAAGMGSMHQW